jgi:hypothetical protein
MWSTPFRRSSQILSRSTCDFSPMGLLLRKAIIQSKRFSNCTHRETNRLSPDRKFQFTKRFKHWTGLLDDLMIWTNGTGQTNQLIYANFLLHNFTDSLVFVKSNDVGLCERFVMKKWRTEKKTRKMIHSLVTSHDCFTWAIWLNFRRTEKFSLESMIYKERK